MTKKTIKFKGDIFIDKEVNLGWTDTNNSNYPYETLVHNYSEESISYSYFNNISHIDHLAEYLGINRRDGSFTFSSRFHLRDNNRTQSFWWEDKFGKNMDADFEITGKCRSQKRAF